jgi:hypothetical protein
MPCFGRRHQTGEAGKQSRRHSAEAKGKLKRRLESDDRRLSLPEEVELGKEIAKREAEEDHDGATAKWKRQRPGRIGAASAS